MSESGKDRLLALLSGSERELVNFKFFPGNKASSGEELCGAAYEALVIAFNGEGHEVIPGTGRTPVHFGEVVSTF